MCKSKYIILCLVILLNLAGILSSCVNNSENQSLNSESSNEDPKESISIMHVDHANSQLNKYIQEFEKKLGFNINIVDSPTNADSRHAKICSLLASGDTSVDIYTINDEMFSMFKSSGYLEPLSKSEFDENLLNLYPQDYIDRLYGDNGEIYSIPFKMDILLLFINENYLDEIGLDSIQTCSDLDLFLNYPWGENKYAYGGAWEKTYVFNEIGLFINLFGGDYYDWQNENTRNAVKFLKFCSDENITPKNEILDQYEQMEEKFIAGKYGLIFMYSGGFKKITNASEQEKNTLAPIMIPEIKNLSTNIATWQYSINIKSEKKDQAKDFLNYASSYQANKLYAELLETAPARIDVIQDEDVYFTGVEFVREYLDSVKLYSRVIPGESIEYLSKMGEYFQQYVMERINLDEYCSLMDSLNVEYNVKK